MSDLVCIRSSAVAACEGRFKTGQWTRGRGYNIEAHSCPKCGHLVAKPIAAQIHPELKDPKDIMRSALLEIAQWPPGANEFWAKKTAGDALAAIMKLKESK